MIMVCFSVSVHAFSQTSVMAVVEDTLPDFSAFGIDDRILLVIIRF
jgi:hypothetical protein